MKNVEITVPVKEFLDILEMYEDASEEELLYAIEEKIIECYENHLESIEKNSQVEEE